MINKGKQRKTKPLHFLTEMDKRYRMNSGKGKGRKTKGNFGSQSDEQYYDKNNPWGF